MSSNYVFCGYDMQDVNSKAGRSTEGINLNSVTVQYNLQNNPELCRMIYEGTIPSMYGNSPTVSDGGTCTVDELPTVYDINEKGEIENVNPMELAQMTQQQQTMPVVQFTGALNPAYHDAAQPTAMVGMPQYNAGYQMQNPYFQPFYGQPNGGFYPINYTPYGAVQYNYNPVSPMSPIPNIQPAMQEWNDYQRTKGFRAPVPTDTDFPGYGLLSGFHRGFDPHVALAPGQDEFYDVSMGGRAGLARVVHEQALANAAMVWGWRPGDVIDRREQMMFPGINNNHDSPLPSKEPVTNPDGTVQRRLTGSATPRRMMANQLPIPNMVATNPYMAGTQMVGGYAMQPTVEVPTPYMQARYNYAIKNGFQSIQEMDNNDFRIIKRCSRAAHSDMSDEEFNEYFEQAWCKQFTDIYEFRKKCAEEEKKMKQASVTSIPKMKITIRRGDKILVKVDCDDPNTYRQHCEGVRRCAASYITPQQYEQMRQYNESVRMLKDMRIAQLHSMAPERKYDDKPMLEFMAHGWVESFFYHLDQQVIIDRANPEKRMKVTRVDQTAFIKRCLERGIGLSPAAASRLETENKMFYVGEEHEDPFIGDKPRGSYGMNANGTPLDLNTYPMYGYATYIPDPERPDISIPFPRRFIQDIYIGYERYCGAINEKSKKKITPVSYEEFAESTGVRIIDDQEFLDKYQGLAGTEKYIEAAKRGVEMQKSLSTHWGTSDPNDEEMPIDVLLEDDDS